MTVPTVFVVDDEDGFRGSLSRLFRSAGLAVSDFASAEEFLAAFDPDTPGCLVLDLAMPEVNGIELQRVLHEELDCEIPIIFLTGHAEVPDGVAALKEGALDFLTKPVEPDVLLGAVRLALERDAECRKERDVLRMLRQLYETLTPREREVMAHVVTGQLSKQIARDLGTAEKTIRIHRGQVMKKMQADSVATLVRMADKLGI
ncbi:MAG: response regulator [marine benthic group bacterium]|jgi:FixJ family two-component response regulator|nr:response regulator [Gemmatimonadota bacterium]MCL7982683.1 response regulator [Gemmatimonadota bacterium]MCL7986170.1 response regulator [Gemmatimonadota bacterium]MCL7990984.1 response regulator [Gemmatimonadota bacterium]